MRITEKTWVEYITRLASLDETAGRKMAEYIDRHGMTDLEALIQYAYALIQKYGEGSAELACQMYDAIAQAAGVSVPPAEPAAIASYGEIARMVGATGQSPPLMQGGVSRLVKQAGADTTLKNAIRDGAEWAWVPHGDTCPFCLTLASRGWQRASKKALKDGHAEHIHAHCDCAYAVRFDSSTTVAGYDPEKYLKQYYDEEGYIDLNDMRRAQYAKNKDKINAQKRAAYAAKRERDKKKTFSKEEEYDILIEKIRTVGKIPKTAQIHIPPVAIDVDSLRFDEEHVNQERHHHVSESDAKKYIRDAAVSITVWCGKYERYFSEYGASYVNREENLIRTAYAAEEFDKNVQALIKELRENGIFG